MFQFVCLKSSHIKGNAGRSASYLISEEENIFLVNIYLRSIYRAYQKFFS